MLLTLAAAASCEAAALRLVMDHEGLRLNESKMTDAAGETWSVTRLSYLVSGVALKKKDGTWVEVTESVAWMNLATKRDAAVFSKVPEGEYAALRFFVGLDEVENGRDPATRGPDHALNPRVNGLHWSWQGGYIFLALEGMWSDAAGKMSGYAYHLGRVPFRTEIVLEGGVKVSGTTEVRVGMDVASILKGVCFAKDGTATHAREGDALALKLKANLAQAFVLKAVEAAQAVSESKMAASESLSLSIGKGFPQPKLAADVILTKSRVELGKRLFGDGRLSRDGTISCASCHDAKKGLSDARRFSVGMEGRTGDRNAMPLFNLAWKESFFWDGRVASLRQQALMPIVDHREMDESLENVVLKLRDLEKDFAEAFGSPGVTAERLGLALEAFLLTLTSHESKFDRSQRGELKLTADEQRGFELFMMEREPRLGTMGADCFHCHGGALFGDHAFRNNGLAIGEDTGRHRVTGAALDKGTFATPSLRNIALTAPYMHDGRFATLEAVLDHYSEGVQRTETLDPNLAKHPDGGLKLTAEEKRCVVAFLKTLTDEGLAKRMTNDE
jgi:cytochrome c peroxidase